MGVYTGKAIVTWGYTQEMFVQFEIRSRVFPAVLSAFLKFQDDATVIRARPVAVNPDP